MTSYAYRAVDEQGRIAKGQRMAANENELARVLKETGLELIEAREKKESTRRPWQRAAPRELALFTAQMTDLLQAGVPFTEALRDVGANTESVLFRETLADTAQAIQQGTSLSSAFAAAPHLFPPVFTAILAAGEISGDLRQTFTNLTRYAETRARLQEQMRRALRYPLFLLLVAFGTVSFMMTMVVPQILQFLNSIDSELPLITKALIAASNFFASDGWLVGVGLVGAILMLLVLRRHSESVALMTDEWLLRLPVVGMALRKLALARFAQSFSILFASGLGIPDSLNGARRTLGNRALTLSLDEARAHIQSGHPLSDAMRPLLPLFALRMIRTGEQSGQLAKSLNDIVLAYDREVDDVTQRLIGSLEPTLTLMIGGLLAWIVLAVLGPVYNNLGKLSGLH